MRVDGGFDWSQAIVWMQSIQKSGAVRATELIAGWARIQQERARKR